MYPVDLWIFFRLFPLIQPNQIPIAINIFDLNMQSCCASFWLTGGGRGCLKNTRQGGQKQKKNQKAKN